MQEKKEYLTAYKIYSKYNGNFFYMVIEGEYEYYKSFKVPKEVEEKWEKELVSTILKKVNTEDISVYEIFNLFDHMSYSESISFLINYINNFRGDTFSKLLLCEKLKSLYCKKKFIDSVTEKEWKEVLNFLNCQKKELLQDEIIVGDFYKEKSYLDKFLSEKAIRDRIDKL